MNILNFHFKLISGTEFMLKKVLLEECIFTISISLLTCLCVLTKLAATIIVLSVIRSSALSEKKFLPLLCLSGYEGLHGNGFLESVKTSLVSLFDFIVSSMKILPFYACFYFSDAALK